jgi:hypothetical protein
MCAAMLHKPPLGSENFYCPNCKKLRTPLRFYWRKSSRGLVRVMPCITCIVSIQGVNPGLEQYVATRRRHGRHIVRSMRRKPCADCAISFPIVCMDFDHVRGEKLLNIGRGTSRSEAVLIAEIAKCDVVCSNCHRIRTALRRLGLPLLKPKFPKQKRGRT